MNRIRTNITMLYAIAVFLFLSLIPDVQAQTIGGSMVTFLNGKIGIRVGGGECAHMATETLRANAAEFYPGDLGADIPTVGDSVWGTLVTVISYSSNQWKDSAPTVAVLPGDIIQYCGSAKIGTTSYPIRHTSVVKSVNTVAASRPNAVFQQNFGGIRTVQSTTIDVTKLIAGSLRIYRPIARKDSANVWKFTVVNNASTAQTYTVMVDVSTVSTINATAANTAGSYRIHKVGTSGTVPAIVDGTASLYAAVAKGNEIYGSPVSIRQLLP